MTKTYHATLFDSYRRAPDGSIRRRVGHIRDADIPIASFDPEYFDAEESDNSITIYQKLGESGRQAVCTLSKAYVSVETSGDPIKIYSGSSLEARNGAIARSEGDAIKHFDLGGKVVAAVGDRRVGPMTASKLEKVIRAFRGEQPSDAGYVRDGKPFNASKMQKVVEQFRRVSGGAK